MKFPENIDLHMHSTASDGTDSPEELIENVRNAGIGLFAVTDHDGIAGAVEVEKKLSEQPDNELMFVKGIEFSCRDEGGKYHILGYGYDAGNEALKNVVQEAHENRLSKGGACGKGSPSWRLLPVCRIILGVATLRMLQASSGKRPILSLCREMPDKASSFAIP